MEQQQHQQQLSPQQEPSQHPQQPLPSADAQPVEEEQAVPRAATSSSQDPQQQRQQQPWLRRLVRISVAAVRAVLVLEFFATLAGPAIARRLRSRRLRSSDDIEDGSSDPGFDPADVLVSYLTGAAGLSSVQLLSNKQLRQAVDSLVTEDFNELGVRDRGRQIRQIVDDIIEAREQQATAPRPSSTARRERVGLGGVGPLKFRNQGRRPAAAAAAGGASGEEGADAAEPPAS